MLSNLLAEKIENVVIYVCDSLRWDFCPRELLSLGVTFKTIASSLYTASCFSSIVSGLHPPRHGVYDWTHVLAENKRGLLGLPDHTVSLWCETTWTDSPPDDSALHRVLGHNQGIPLEEIDEPFIYVEDDQGGHCPYGYSFNEWKGQGFTDYYESFYSYYGQRDRDELIQQYRRGIDLSIKRFKERLQTLLGRGLSESTLVIFTSDHGELLGEYGGLVGHGRPACPELVYVPTVFIHPALNASVDQTGVMRHVDLLPTINRLLGVDLSYKTDGVNLLQERSLPDRGLNFRDEGSAEAQPYLKRHFTYRAKSVWDSNGGHIFQEMGALKSVPFFIWRMFLSQHKEFAYLRAQCKRRALFDKFRLHRHSLKHLCASYIRYGTPQFAKDEALKSLRQYLSNMANAQVEAQGEVQGMDEEIEKRLRDLGYLD